jgi:hypothetical protein
MFVRLCYELELCEVHTKHECEERAVRPSRERRDPTFRFDISIRHFDPTFRSGHSILGGRLRDEY